MRAATRISLAAAVVALTATTCAAAAAAGTPVIHPGQRLGVAGTRIYCAAETKSTGVLTTCILAKGGTQSPEGYAVGIGDAVVGVMHFVGSSTPTVFVRAQPHLGATAPASRGRGTITLGVGGKVAVAGSHVMLTVSKLNGSPFLAVWVAGANFVGISAQVVNVQRWSGGAAKLAYSAAEPRR